MLPKIVFIRAKLDDTDEAAYQLHLVSDPKVFAFGTFHCDALHVWD